MTGKRILAVILALCIAAGLAVDPNTGKTARANIIAEYQMEELTDATYKIVSYLLTDTKVEVPEIISGKKVTVIGHRAFAYKNTLEEVTIPSSVTVIEGQAFQYCSALKKVVIPSSGLREIGDFTFDGCGLEEIVLPSGVEKIGGSAFLNCSKMTAVSIPSTVTEIGASAFSGCNKVDGIILPPGVTKIEAHTFSNCTSLTKIEIPDGVSSIGELAFYGCAGLTEIIIPDKVTDIGRFAFERCKNLIKITLPAGLTSVQAGILQGCEKLEQVHIPSGVASIGEDAFESCASLTEIHIPASVSSIGNRAFSECAQLQDVYYSGTQEQWNQVTVASQGNESLAGATIHFETASEPAGDYEYNKLDDETIEITKYTGTDTVVEIPAQIDGRHVVRIGENAFMNCENITQLSIPNSVTIIGKGAFSRCRTLQEINIPNSVTIIGEAAFANCSSLKDITIPNSVNLIGSAAFAQCSVLEEISLPSGVVNIDDYTFQNSGLLTIHIPKSVVRIGENSFANCETLKDVYYEGTKEQWNQIKISSIGNSSLTNAVVHCIDDDLLSENYEYEAISDGTIAITKYKGSETEVKIPSQIDGKTVTVIRANVFQSNEDIKEITIPSCVTSFMGGAIDDCPNLMAFAVDIESESYSSVDGVLFNKEKTELVRCPEGKSGEYMVPDGVDLIGAYAFQSCDKLKGITVPDGVTKIGIAAFWKCTEVIDVTLPDSVTEIGSKAFSGCENLIKIHIPDSIEVLQGSTFQFCKSLTEIIIPDGVTRIDSTVFVACENLRSIVIPSSVIRIANTAFRFGDMWPINLKDVYYSGTKEEWEQIEVPGEKESVSERLWLTATIHFKNDPIVLPEEPIQPEVRNPKEELESLKSNGTFQMDDFKHYLTEEQLGIMEDYLYTWLAQVNYAYQYSGSSTVKELVMKKAGIDPDGDFASGMEQAITHISVNTKYGTKIFEITMGLGQPDGSGNLYPGYSVMHYEILEKSGVPSDVPVSGQIVRDYYADMGAFVESVKRASEDSLHGTYQWQQLEDEMTAGVLIDKTAAEIVGNKNGSFSDGTFTIYAQPLFAYSKIVKISCPVDVHVYGMDGQEAGSIVDNKPSGGNQHVRLDVDGDTKTVYLAGDDYYLNLRGTGTGTMKYEVEEIANEEVRRNVQFLELQLKNDMQYEGYVFRPLNIDRDLYALRAVEKNGTGGEVFRADGDSYQPSFKKVQGLSLSQKNTSLESNRTVQLSASHYPLDASNPNLRWATDNESVARVDENGLVTAVGSGRATVTVSTKDGSFLKQFCVIDVAGSNSADNNPGHTGGENSGTGGNGSGGNGSGSTGGSSAGGFSPGGASTPDGTVQKPSVVKVHYVLQFDLNGGTKTSRRTMTLLSGDLPGIMPKAQRKDYVFNGWYTQAEGGTKVSGDKPLEEAATLYARWTKAAAPAKPASLKLQSKKKGQIQAGFQAIDGAAGYQVDYSLKKSFVSAKTKEVRKSAKAKTITGLKAGKKYYIRVRAYSLDSMGNRIYGAYSAVKSVIVKS
ncbi:MAG: leucine-rich repeat protein [Eubacterium sp.]|nr:leucine-rich repeat protein [Eubacterium sp.]